MELEGWTLVAWIGTAVAMLAFLKFCLTRICRLSCKDLSCVKNDACEPRDV